MYGEQHYGLIQCKVCSKIYEEPRLLDCLHSFCSSCLQKHIETTTRPSDACVQCPLCQEDSTLQNSSKDFPKNALLEKFITQVRKDKTTVIAEREVEKMTYEALSEEDLQCPDVLATVQQVATAAGYVIADNVPTQDQSHNILLQKKKTGLNLKTSQLQVRAMDLVQSIDKVNNSIQEWSETKSNVREMIKQRSLEMQDHVKSVERRLLAQLDDKDNEVVEKDKAFAVKKRLHKILRSSLSIVDFLRLLVEYGEANDVDTYSELIRNREQKVNSGPVVLTRNMLSFECKSIDVDKTLEKLFGSLNVVSETTEVWNPHKPINKVNTEINGNIVNEPDYNVDRLVESEMGHHPTENENTNNNNLEKEFLETQNEHVSGLSRRHTYKPQPRGNRRAPPTKSISFDSSYTSGPYPYTTSAHQELHNSLLYDNKQGQHSTEFEILNENESQTGSLRKLTKQNTEVDNDYFQSAIDSLISSSKVTHPFAPKCRRGSAPPSMVIDTLNRRRLSALSILERANISTDGLAVTTDIELGMNEARQEWLRESLRRKVNNDESIQEIV